MRYRSKLPWEISAPDVDHPHGSGTNRPIALTHDAVDEHQLRRTGLRIHGSVDYDTGAGIVNVPFDELVTAQMANEKDPGLGLFGFLTTFSVPTGIAAPSDSLNFIFWLGGINLYDDPIDSTKVVIKDGSNHYIPFVFNVTLLDSNARNNSALGGLSASSVTCTLAGTAVPMFFSPQDFDAGSIIIEAPATDGYFEYRDGGDLNPKFDPDTGAPI